MHRVSLRIEGIVEVGDRNQIIGAVDDPLGEEEARDQFPIIAGGAHGDGEGLSLQADLQGLLGGEEIVGQVGGAIGGDALARDSDRARGHGLRP